MKLIILLAVAGLSNAAKLDNTYLPPSHAPTSGGSDNFLQAPGSQFGPNSAYTGPNAAPQNLNLAHSSNYNPWRQGNDYAPVNNEFTDRPIGNQIPQERAQAAFERNAKILRLENQNDGENFAYNYETENGISADEQGVATWQHGVDAQGGFSYTGDDGQFYSIRYTAGLNGFVPQGDHLPTPPPIPVEIQQALEKNARDEAAGIYDDGSYKEGKYNSGDNHNENNGYNYNQGNGNQGYGNQNQHQSNLELVNDEDTVVTNNALIRDNYQQPGAFGNRGPKNQAPFGNPNSNQGPSSNQAHSGVTQAYLPPFGRQNNQPSSKLQQNQQTAFGRQSQTPTSSYQGSSFGNQKPAFGNPGYSSQVPRNQGPRSQASRAYLPPFERQRAPSNQRSLNNQQPGFSNQIPRTQGSAATNNAYLPPSGK